MDKESAEKFLKSITYKGRRLLIDLEIIDPDKALNDDLLEKLEEREEILGCRIINHIWDTSFNDIVDKQLVQKAKDDLLKTFDKLLF